MYRAIITPKETTLTIELPYQMIGKSVEVIAFEIEKNGENVVNPEDPSTGNRKWSYEEAVSFYKANAIDFSKIKKWKREDLYE